MLPHLRKAVTVILSRMHPEDGEHDERDGRDGHEDEGLKAAADDLIEAVHQKDADGVVTALRSAFEMLDRPEEPEEEDDSPEESARD